VSRGRYGMITRDDGSKGSAHRWSYVNFHGPVPDGMLVRHTCDNKVCVNPAHLEIGTKSDNGIDASERGQLPRGSRHHFSVLTEADIPAIRAQLRDGISETQIAADFGVGRSAINHIRRGKSWTHIKEAS